ncbi:MAG: glycosyl hydrolase 53 family protein [Clostridium sp.]
MFKKCLKLLFTFVMCCLLSFSEIIFSAPDKADAYSNFASGADIGWVNQLESKGIKWVNDYGYNEDVLKILKDHGVDSVRLRVFVNPPQDGMWYSQKGTVMLGYCDKNSVVSMAKRAKNMGFRIMIDFHYSDYFADPAIQDIPSAWKNHSFSQLQDDVYNHTYDVMSSLAREGIYPEWVQVGNEINSGMLLPQGSIWKSGSTPDTKNLSQLINKGYDAVKNVSSSSKVIIHLANGHDNSLFRRVFDSLTYNGTKFDVIGMSYYPYWIGSKYTDNIDKLAYNLNDMASRYNKEVMVCEVGGLTTESTESYNLVKATIEKVKAVPNSKGIGVFYWEPCSSPDVLPDSYPLGACTKISDNTLKFNDAINAFKNQRSFPNTSVKYKIVNRLSGKALNVSKGSWDDGATIEQYDYYGWDSQKWYIVNDGNGYYSIKNAGNGKVLDILSRSQYDGAYCVQWTSNGGYNQEWSFTKTWDSYYKIVNRNSGKILDINASSKDNGAQAIQWTDKDGWNQEWLFIEVE